MMQVVFQSQTKNGVRTLVVFALYGAYFDKALKSFVHHFVIVSGEGLDQTEAYYRVGGSDFVSAPIFFSDSNHPDFFDYCAKGLIVESVSTELPQDSKSFLRETLNHLRTNLTVDELGESWSIRQDASPDVDPTPQFPWAVVKHLQQIHWPHSYKWG